MPLFVDKVTIEAFTRDLIEGVCRRYPPQIDNDPAKRPSEARLTRIVEDACAQARSFKVEQRLGWLGKARLGNALRWQLKERGFSQQFTDLMTEAVIVEVSR